jgi:tetratricopeptide (TPR) repeat protein
LLQTELTSKQRARALTIRGFYSNEVGHDARVSLADLDEAVRLNPYSADAYYNRGLVYSGSQRYELAIADFTRAIELAPRARTHDSRGKVYLKAGNFAAALSDFSRSIELDPEFAKAWRHRAEIRAAAGDYELARQDVMMALRLRPGYKRAQQSLQRIEELAGKSPMPFGVARPSDEQEKDD